MKKIIIISIVLMLLIFSSPLIDAVETSRILLQQGCEEDDLVCFLQALGSTASLPEESMNELRRAEAMCLTGGSTNIDLVTYLDPNAVRSCILSTRPVQFSQEAWYAAVNAYYTTEHIVKVTEQWVLVNLFNKDTSCIGQLDDTLCTPNNGLSQIILPADAVSQESIKKMCEDNTGTMRNGRDCNARYSFVCKAQKCNKMVPAKFLCESCVGDLTQQIGLTDTCLSSTEDGSISCRVEIEEIPPITAITYRDLLTAGYDDYAAEFNVKMINTIGSNGEHLDVRNDMIANMLSCNGIAYPFSISSISETQQNVQNELDTIRPLLITRGCCESLNGRMVRSDGNECVEQQQITTQTAQTDEQTSVGSGDPVEPAKNWFCRTLGWFC